MLGNSLPHKAAIPFLTWIVARGDSHQTNPEVALIHWFTTFICVHDVTALMNIQGGVQDFTHKPPKAINTGGWVESLPKFVNSFRHCTSLIFLAHLDNHILLSDSLHHSLQVGMF